MKDRVWKIRNKDTGEFSMGGTSSRLWTRVGKTWSNIGHVKNHLHSFIYQDGSVRDVYRNAEIVEIEVDYNECKAVDVEEFVKEWLE